MFFKVAQSLFLQQKPLTKDTAQMALFLVVNESATAKIDLSKAESHRKVCWLGLNEGTKRIFTCSRVSPKPSKSVLEQ